MLNHHGAGPVLDALGDATRRAIVQQLSSGPATVSEIAEPLEITRSAVLQHLLVLESSNLVSSEKVGRVRMCRIDPEGLELARTWIDLLRNRWEQRLDRLGDLLEEANQEEE